MRSDFKDGKKENEKFKILDFFNVEFSLVEESFLDFELELEFESEFEFRKVIKVRDYIFFIIGSKYF